MWNHKIAYLPMLKLLFDRIYICYVDLGPSLIGIITGWKLKAIGGSDALIYAIPVSKTSMKWIKIITKKKQSKQTLLKTTRSLLAFNNIFEYFFGNWK